MATTDPITGVTLRDQGDFATGGLQLGQLLQGLRTMVLPRFASTSARDAAYTAASVPLAQGMLCVVAGVLQEHDGTNWVDIGGTGAWTTYTPTLRTAAGSPTVGNGTLTGRFRRLGKLIVVRIFLSVGSTSNMGAGVITFDLPATAINDGSYQNLGVKAFASDTKVYPGAADIAPGGTVCSPLLPRSSTTTDMTNAQGANNAGAAGTGIPVVASDFTFKAGSNISIFGTYEAA